MPKARLLWVLCVVGSLAACKQESSPFCPKGMSEVAQRSAQGKSVWCESSDKQSAQWVEWHPGQTQLRQRCTYRNGKPEGSFTAWHPNGKPWVQGQFVDGKKVGKWKQWDASGNEVAEGDYTADRLVAGAPVAGMAMCEKVASGR